jgi:hypothetical protein
MAKLSGAAAEVRLAEAWETVFGQDPAAQQIIHVLTRPVGWRAFLADDRNPDQSLSERDFLISMRDFAFARGQLITLPVRCLRRAALPARSTGWIAG